MKSWLIIMLLAAPWAPAQNSSQDCVPAYENHNQIDYGPLIFDHLSGRAVDPSSLQMPRVCLGLFKEGNHKLVATASTDENGNFKFSVVPLGRYRLVVHADGLCAANVPLRIVRAKNSSKSRELVLHMRPSGIDACSYGDYK